MQCWEHNWRADEQDRLVLQCRHDDLMRRTDRVNVRWTIRDSKVAGVHHAQIDVERLPELFGAPRALLGSAYAAGISPAVLDFVAALDVLASVLVQPANVRLEPRIEHSDA